VVGYGEKIRTVEGMNFSMVGFLTALGGAILATVGSWVALGATNSDPFNNPFGPAMGAGLALSCVSLILGFLSVILYLVGFSNVYGGRFEFGPEQDKWVTRALWSLIITIILYITSAGVGGVLAILLLGGGLIGGQGPDPGAVATLFLVTAILGALTQFCMACTILFPIRTFAKPEHSPFLALVTLLFILGPVAGNAINLVTFDPSRGGALGGLFGGGFGPGTILSNVMFAVALALSLFTYVLMKKRISSGEVQPQLRPMTVVPYYPMYPTYAGYPGYPYAYPQQYPAYPQPQYPAYPPQYPAYPPQYPQAFPPNQAAPAPPAAVTPIPAPGAEPPKPEEAKEKKPPETSA